jgi:hypothetical protein
MLIGRTRLQADLLDRREWDPGSLVIAGSPGYLKMEIGELHAEVIGGSLDNLVIDEPDGQLGHPTDKPLSTRSA